MKTLRLSRASLVLPALAAAAASGALTLTGVSANPSLLRPTSGVAYATVSGTITATSPGETASLSIDGARRADGTTLSVALFRDYQTEIAAGLLASGSYTGALFEYAFTPATEPGVYDRALDLAEPSRLRLFSNASGSTLGVEYSVTVQAVPEPATLAALGLGALGLLRRRNKR